MFDKMMLKEGVNEIVCLLMEDETCTFGMARTTANPTFMCLSPLESSEKYHKMEMERSVVLHHKEISHGKTRT